MDFIKKRVTGDDTRETSEKLDAEERSSSNGLKLSVVVTDNILQAEQISSRIGIVIDGELIALESPSRLRKIYGHGYTLEMTLPRYQSSKKKDLSMYQDSLWGKVESKLIKRFGSDIMVTDKFLDRRIYMIPMHGVTKQFMRKGSGLQSSFALLNSLLSEGYISSFTFSLTGLQQVYSWFSHMTKQQRDAMHERREKARRLSKRRSRKKRPNYSRKRRF